MSEPVKQASFPEVAGLQYIKPTATYQYGGEPEQFAEYWPGAEEAPLLLLIHGGCWLNQFDLTHIRPLASELASRGIAVLSIEYRRIGDSGGGYPGTFDDIKSAAAFASNLNHQHLFVAGHSAGGHLALWLAATSDLTTLKGAIGLAAITDIETYAQGQSGCQRATSQLMGGMPQDQPARYGQYSPIRLPAARPALILHGEDDAIVDINQATSFCSEKDNCQLSMLKGLGHFDAIDPRGKVPSEIVDQIHKWLADNE